MVSIIVRFTSNNVHRWAEAPENRSYLRNSHRHTMKVEAEVQVFHRERDIEFHDFQDFCITAFPQGDVGNKSCETLAKELCLEIITAYGKDRRVTVSVFEDGEVGAKYYHGGGESD